MTRRAPGAAPRQAPRHLRSPGRGSTYLRWGAVASVVVGLLLALQYLGGGLATRLGVVTRNQAFTELYFPEPHALPGRLQAGHPLGLAFVVDNHEGGPRTYRFEVTLTKASEHLLLASGSLQVADQATKHVRLSIARRLPPGSETLSVRLLSPAERIDLHLQGPPR